MKYYVCWKDSRTGRQGRSEIPMSQKAAETWVRDGNRQGQQYGTCYWTEEVSDEEAEKVKAAVVEGWTL